MTELGNQTLLLLIKSKKGIVCGHILVPAYKGVKEKENKKIYKDLRIEVEHQWNMKSSVISIVVVALGAVSPRFKTFVQRLDLPELNWYLLQKSALLGTISILRQVL